MESWQSILTHPFTLGLGLGLIFCGLTWKNSLAGRWRAKKEKEQLIQELRELQSHLNVQLKINASGNSTLQQELEQLRQQNENLRINLATTQQKPGRAELRQLQVFELAIRQLREQAPGFAPSWERALREAEAEIEAHDSGLKKWVKQLVAPPAPAKITGAAPADQPQQNAPIDF